MSRERTVSDVRSRVDHPIIDNDAHFIEFMPEVLEHLRALAGNGPVRIFEEVTSMISATRRFLDRLLHLQCLRLRSGQGKISGTPRGAHLLQHRLWLRFA